MKNSFGIALAIMAAIWAYVALALLDQHVVVWAGFVAWAAYHTVKEKEALVPTITGTIFGGVVAIISLVIIAIIAGPIGNGAIAAAIAIGITVYVLTAVKAFGNIPANVLGFAGTAAIFKEQVLENMVLQSAMDGDVIGVVSLNLHHPLVIAALSFIGGAIFANLTVKLAAKLG